MDIDKIYDFAIKSFSDFFHNVVKTLKSAKIIYKPIISKPEEIESINNGDERNTVEPRVNPKLFGFVALSIFFGLGINTVVLTELEISDLLFNIIFLTTSWFFYGICIFVACWLLQGKGTFTDTISIVMQLLAAIFIVSCFINLFIKGFLISNILKSIAPVNLYLEDILSRQFGIYYIIHTLLLSVYVPIGIKPIHRFGILRLIIVGLLPIIAAIFGWLVYSNFGRLAS